MIFSELAADLFGAVPCPLFVLISGIVDLVFQYSSTEAGSSNTAVVFFNAVWISAGPM